VGSNTSGLKRGGPGRPKGVPNKATADAKAFAEGLVDDPVYLAKLTRDLRARKVAPPIEHMLWHYAKRKPKDVIELEERLDVNALNRMSDDELRARLEALMTKAGAQCYGRNRKRVRDRARRLSAGRRACQRPHSQRSATSLAHQFIEPDHRGIDRCRPRGAGEGFVQRH
jgi:hypothetical protein